MIDGADKAIQYLRDQGKKLYFVTNSSGRSRQGLVDKFAKLGITIYEHEAFPSGFTTAVYLRKQHPEITKVYMIGEQGFKDQLTGYDDGSGVKIEVVGGPEETGISMTHEEYETYPIDPEIGVVVVGYDLNISYRKICMGNLYLQQGCKFIASNNDKYDMIRCNIDGKIINRPIPTTGPVLDTLEYTSGQTPVVCGKPSSEVFSLICSVAGIKAEEKDKCIMIGDRITTDIQMAHNVGIDSALVLTGCNSVEDLDKPSENPNLIKPTYVFDSLNSFAS